MSDLRQMITVGDSYAYEFSFMEKDLDAFIRLSGDSNNIHRDLSAAAESPMHVMAVPGLLTALVFSRILGTVFPGHGTVYRSQTLDFIRPVVLHSLYEASFVVEHVNQERHRATVRTTVVEKVSGRPCVLGMAVVINLKRI